MASTTESKNDQYGSGRRHGPPTEEKRRQWEAEFKQEFLDEYHKRHGDELISAEQTWELFQAVEERRHAKMKERRSSPSHHGDHPPPQSSDNSDHSPPPPQQHGEHSSPPRHRGGRHHFEEKRKQMLSELQQDFQKDFSATHGTENINIDQAWSLIQKVKQSKREKWQANRQKHGPRHGSGDRGRHSPPANQ